MENLKHVGRIKDNGRRCLVVFRTLPGDAFNCLVVTTENLDDSYHNALINLVESNAAQIAYEFAEVLARSFFPDGSTMLPSLHVKGLLSKVPTDKVEMIPNNQTSILLSDLNQLIAEQRGISVQDLAIKDDPKQNVEIQELATVKDLPEEKEDISKTTSSMAKSSNAPLTDEDLARKYRSDADRLSKEAAQLRRMAEELVPTKKKETVKA
jgi:hypothetical protein